MLGGVLITGCLNPARIKGSHAAIRTRKLAADTLFDAVKTDRRGDELRRSRNFKSRFRKGLNIGKSMTGTGALAAAQARHSKPAVPSLPRAADYAFPRPAADFPKIDDPKPTRGGF